MLKRPVRSEEGTDLAQKSVQILQTLQPFFRERSSEMMGARSTSSSSFSASVFAGYQRQLFDISIRRQSNQRRK